MQENSRRAETPTRNAGTGMPHPVPRTGYGPDRSCATLPATSADTPAVARYPVAGAPAGMTGMGMTVLLSGTDFRIPLCQGNRQSTCFEFRSIR